VEAIVKLARDKGFWPKLTDNSNSPNAFDIVGSDAFVSRFEDLMFAKEDERGDNSNQHSKILKNAIFSSIRMVEEVQILSKYNLICRINFLIFLGE
jgi:hypothetical protein